MRIKLLNTSGYAGMHEVKFPVEVEGDRLGHGSWRITDDELVRIGCDMTYFPDKLWHFHPDSAEAV